MSDLFPEVVPVQHLFPFAISPSAIGTALQCWRMYGWEYIECVPRESTPEQQYGTDTHTVHEGWFKHGKAPNPDGDGPNRSAFATMHLWPSPNLVDEIEIHIWVMTEHAVYHGFQDLGYETDYEVPDLSKTPVEIAFGAKKKVRLRVVGDHKTTSDLKWVKDADDLRKDPQAIVYAAAAMARHNVDRVVIKWVYVTRAQQPKKKVVEFILTREEVEKGLDALDIVAREIYRVRAEAELLPVEELVKYVMSMPYNASSCGAYGGCRHAKSGRCVLTNKEKIRGLMAQQTLKERLAEKQKLAKSNGQPTEELKPSGKVTVAASVKTTGEKPLSAKEKAEAARAELQRLQDEADAEEQAAKDAEDLAAREAEETAKSKSKPAKKDKAAAVPKSTEVERDADGDLETLDAIRVIVREEFQTIAMQLAEVFGKIGGL